MKIIRAAAATAALAASLMAGPAIIAVATDATDVTAACGSRTWTYDRSVTSGGSTIYVYVSGPFTHYDSVWRGHSWNQRVCGPS